MTQQETLDSVEAAAKAGRALRLNKADTWTLWNITESMPPEFPEEGDAVLRMTADQREALDRLEAAAEHSGGSRALRLNKAETRNLWDIIEAMTPKDPGDMEEVLRVARQCDGSADDEDDEERPTAPPSRRPMSSLHTTSGGEWTSGMPPAALFARR